MSEVQIYALAILIHIRNCSFVFYFGRNNKLFNGFFRCIYFGVFSFGNFRDNTYKKVLVGRKMSMIVQKRQYILSSK